jgi:hypothetical protein
MPDIIDRPARAEGPELMHRAPECGLCNNECTFEGDGWGCETCGVSWPDELAPGEWTESDKPACPSRHQPWLDNEYITSPDKRQEWVQCILTEGHDTEKHRADSVTAWYDGGKYADPWMP